MKMENNNLLKNLLITADILNTINGGMSMPEVNLNKSAESYLLDIKAPGVDSSTLRVEINDNTMYVYHLLTLFENQPDRKGLQVPCFIRVLPIPYDVDVRNISAKFEDGKLHIKMPCNEFSNGYHKRVDITHV